MEFEFDAFISHASEDKDAFVRPLANALKQFGCKVWYDEFSLGIGDSLSESVDHGLERSRYGIVVISTHFIKKRWPKRELRGLVAREIGGREKVILPIWHGVTHGEVLRFSPPLADSVAVETSNKPAEAVALQLLKEIRPDIYEQRSRETLIDEPDTQEALRVLQDELDAVKEALAEYQCPHCGAQLLETASVDLSEKVSDVYEAFACGYAHVGGELRSVCPSHPEFPAVDDYELSFGPSFFKKGEWRCYASPKNFRGRLYTPKEGTGPTKEFAEKDFREKFGA